MKQVNILEAKTDFSKLIRLLETKKEDYITVARNGKPVAKVENLSFLTHNELIPGYEEKCIIPV